MRAFVFAAVAIAGIPAFAAETMIFKCVADNGKITYSEAPCHGETWHRLGTPAPDKRTRDLPEPASQPAPPAAPAPKNVARPRVVKLPTPP